MFIIFNVIIQLYTLWTKVQKIIQGKTSYYMHAPVFLTCKYTRQTNIMMIFIQSLLFVLYWICVLFTEILLNIYAYNRHVISCYKTFDAKIQYEHVCVLVEFCLYEKIKNMYFLNQYWGFFSIKSWIWIWF